MSKGAHEDLCHCCLAVILTYSSCLFAPFLADVFRAWKLVVDKFRVRHQRLLSLVKILFGVCVCLCVCV